MCIYEEGDYVEKQITLCKMNAYLSLDCELIVVWTYTHTYMHAHTHR